MKMLKEKLSSIQSAELSDKVNELSEKWKWVLQNEAFDNMDKTIWVATERLKKEWFTHAKDVMKNVVDIAHAENASDISKWIDGLSWVMDSAWKMLWSVASTFEDMLSSLFKGLWLDKLFKSIGRMFWMKFEENAWDKKDGETNENISHEASDVEKVQLQDAAWRQLCKLNTKYGSIVDTTKKEEFRKVFDVYIKDSWVTDKEALLQKFTSDISWEMSLFSLFALSNKTPQSKEFSADELSKQQSAFNTFKKSLNESGIIKIEISQEKIQEDIIKHMESYGWVNESNRAEKIKILEAKFKTPKYQAIMADIQKVVEQKQEVSVGAFAFDMLAKAPGMLWDLMGDIIPWSALTIHAIDGAFYFGLRTYTALTTSGFDSALSVISGVELDKMWEIPPEKDLLL